MAEFTRPSNQDQHKVPQVYLKKFGYQDNNNQWKVSVMKRGEHFSRQKSIGSFTAQTNIFDIESDDKRIQRMFERLNGELENEYNNILTDLDEKGSLSDKSYAYLLQLTGNLIVRSDDWREQIRFLLASDRKENFLKIITGHFCENEEEFNMIHELEFYRLLVELPVEEALNRVLLYFLDHLMIRLSMYEIVLLKAIEQKPWMTTSNPIVVKNRTAKMEFFTKESEIYFPLSPQYLAYFHYAGSDDKQNKYRAYASNRIYQAEEADILPLRDIILGNECEYAIFAGNFHYRADEKKEIKGEKA